MADIAQVLAKNLKRLRSEQGLSQAELAHLAGVSLGTIQGYESGRRWPELPYIKAIAFILKCSDIALYQEPIKWASLSQRKLAEILIEKDILIESLEEQTKHKDRYIEALEDLGSLDDEIIAKAHEIADSPSETTRNDGG